MPMLHERQAGDREGARANITDLGPYGALNYARARLARESGQNDALARRRRRIDILTIREAARTLLADVRSARRLAACHAVGLRTLDAAVTRITDRRR